MGSVVVLGSFNADMVFRAARQPRPGETILGTGFALGPGGKGSNQAVAAARAGAAVRFITRLGRDPFAEMARAVWRAAGVEPLVAEEDGLPTGAAGIFVDAATGENAITVCPGANGALSAADADRHAEALRGAAVVLTQLEQPLDAAERALALGRAGGAVTVLNPAPARDLADGLLALCDLVTPNQTEALLLTGIDAGDAAGAARAAAALVARGAGAALVTLGAAGALLHAGGRSTHVPAFGAGAVVDTTGAGDAFNGALAAALAEGMDLALAARFGAAAAAICVTRPGAAAAMPARDEIARLFSHSGH